jgi:sortase A
MRRAVRIAGTLLLGAGILMLAWVVVVWKWQDPFTALYTTYQQHRLAAGYEQRVAAYKPLPQPTAGATPAQRPGAANPERGATKPGREQVTAWPQIVAAEARRYRLSLREGDPVGRIKVPRMGLDSVLVAGTDHSSLTKGPGWYRGSFLPGEGQLIYIAGHRTTYLAPFAHIDRMQPGDLVTLEVPYGTFVYRVTGHVIVPANDVERLQSHGREVVALQACHPRFFATHRYIVYARPVRAFPRGGHPYVPKTGTASRPSA